jgi:hypothetical protein
VVVEMNYKHGGYSKGVWIAIPKLTVKEVMSRLEDMEYEPALINPRHEAIQRAIVKELSKSTWRTLRKTNPEDGLIL